MSKWFYLYLGATIGGLTIFCAERAMPPGWPAAGLIVYFAVWGLALNYAFARFIAVTADAVVQRDGGTS